MTTRVETINALLSGMARIHAPCIAEESEPLTTQSCLLAAFIVWPLGLVVYVHYIVTLADILTSHWIFFVSIV